MVLGMGGASSQQIDIDIATSGADQAQQALGGVAQALGGVRAQAVLAGGALGALAVGGMAKAVSAAADFEEGMVDLEKVTNPETARLMGDEIQTMATKMPMAHEELQNIAVAAGKLGIEGVDNIKDYTETVAMMSTATDLTADEAADAFARIGTLMDVPTEKMGNMGSAMNELGNTMATSAAEITNVMVRQGANFRTAGIGTEEALGLAAAMNEVAPNSRLAASGMGMMLKQMADPSNVEVMAELLGVTSDEFIRMRDEEPSETLLKISEAAAASKGNHDLLQAAVGDAAQQFARLGGNTDQARAAMERSGTAWEENTSLTEEFEASASTLHAQIQLLRNSLHNLAIGVGQVFLPYITDAVMKLTAFINESKLMTEVLTSNRIATGLAVAALAGLTMVLVGLSGLIGSVVVAISPLAALFLAVAYAVNAARDNFHLIEADVQRVRDALGLLSGPLENLRVLVGLVAGDVSDHFSGMNDAVGNAVANMVGWIADRLVAAIESFAAAANVALMNATLWWIDHGDAVLERISAIIAAIQDYISRGLDALRAAYDAVIGPANAAYDALEAFATLTVPAFIQNLIDRLRDLADIDTTAIDTLKDTIGNLATAFWALESAASEALTSLIEDVQTLADSAVSEQLGTMSGAVDDLATAWDDASIAASAAITAHIADVERLAADTTIADDVVPAIESLEDAWADAGTAATDAADRMVEATLRLTEEAVPPLEEQMTPAVEGIGEKYGGLARTVAMLTPGILGSLVSLGSQFVSTGTLARIGISGIGKRLLGLTGPVGWAISLSWMLYDAWNNNVLGMKDATDKAFPSIDGVIRTTMRGLREIVASTVETVQRIWGEHGTWFIDESKRWIMGAATVIGGILWVIYDNFQWIIDLVVFAWETGLGIVEGIIDGFFTTVRILQAVFAGEWEQAWDLLVDYLKRTFGGIKEWFYEWFKGWNDRTEQFLTAFYEWFVTWLTNVGLYIRDDFGEDMFAAFTVAGERLLDAGRWLVGRVISDDDSLFRAANAEIKKYVEAHMADALEKAFVVVGRAILGSVDWFIGRVMTDEDSLMRALNDAIKDYVENQLADDAEAAFRVAGGAIIEGVEWFIGRVMTDDDSLFRAMNDAIKKFVEGTLANTAEAAFRVAGEAVIDAAEWLVGRIITDEDSLFRQMNDAIKSFLTDTAPSILNTAGETAFQAVLDAGQWLWDNLIGNEDALLKKMNDAIKTFLTDTVPSILETAAKAAFQGILDAAEWLWDQLIRNSVIKDIIGAIDTYLRNAAKNTLEGAAKALGGAVTTAFGNALDFAGEAMRAARAAVNAAKTWISNNMPSNPLSGKSTSGRSTSKGGSTPSRSPSGGTRRRSNIPNSSGTTDEGKPRGMASGAGMATGGIVTSPMHALIGEGGEAEAVIPLSKLAGMFRHASAAGARAAMGDVGAGRRGGGGRTHIRIDTIETQAEDGVELADEFVTELRSRNLN